MLSNGSMHISGTDRHSDSSIIRKKNGYFITKLIFKNY